MRRPSKAVDDLVIVSESEGAGDMDGNVLSNDELDGAQFTGDVALVNEGANVGLWVGGSNGGRIMINADGTFDFDADGDFDSLDEGETTTTTFTYEIQTNVGATQEEDITVDFDSHGFCAGDIVSTQIAGVTITSSNPTILR